MNRLRSKIYLKNITLLLYKAVSCYILHLYFEVKLKYILGVEKDN